MDKQKETVSRKILQVVAFLIWVVVAAVCFTVAAWSLQGCERVVYVERPFLRSPNAPGGDDLQMEDCEQYHNKAELNCSMGLPI